MTRKLLTNFNSKPYYDDFDIEKDFLRVLFKPGTALQARELTQLQTILSEQIQRFGNHIFKDGSPVLDGSFNVDVNVKYIKLNDLQNGVEVSSYLDELEGKLLVSGGNYPVKFRVRKVVKKTSSEPNLIIGVYESGGDEIDPAGNQELTTQYELGSLSRTITTLTSAPNIEISGPSSIASVNEGIFYISGFFHKVDNQTIVLEQYSKTPTCRVGLEVEESVVTTSDDISLFDNAQSSTNFSAPGSDRFKMELVLKKNQLDSSEGNIITNNASCEFYEFVRVRNGQKVDQIKNSQYSYLGEELARRTYDTNGDFVVRAFTLDVDLDPNDDTKLLGTLDTGKAYVKGYEIETISPISIPIDKGRDTNQVLEENVNTFIGNYVYVDFPASLSGEVLPDISQNQKLDVYDSTPTKIGSCRIKQLNYESSKGYRLSFFDLQLDSTLNPLRTSKDIVSFRNESGTGDVFVVSSESRDPNVSPVTTIVSQQERNPLLFDISRSSVKSVSDVSFFYNKLLDTQAVYDGSSNSTIDITLPSSSGDEFLLSPNTGLNYPQELLKSNFIILNKNTGENYSSFNVSISSSTTATISIPQDLSGQSLNVYFKVQSNTGSFRTKIKQSGTYVIDSSKQTSLDGMKSIGTKVSIDGYSDIIKIVSIIGDDGVTDIKDKYVFDNGQTDTFYDFGSLKLKSGVAVPQDGSFTVNFEYFQHNSDGYFTRDSYPSDYQDFPVYFSKTTGKSYSLFDTIDYRPTRVSSDVIQGSRIPYGAAADFLEVSYEYYLPRIDKIVLTKDKDFRVIKGVSSNSPKTPPDDPNSMSLYIITIPPYTYSDDDVNIIPIHNRRYTMKDIGILDRRIEELQARSNLRLLQEKTKNVQIRNSSGLDIFKNGILIDDFSGHDVGDVSSSDYRCSIDFDTQELRSSFYSNSYDVEFDSTNSTNVVKEGSLLLLNHTEVEHQIQPLASKSVNLNPHKMAYWFGEIKINPSSDMWFSQTLKPRVNINESGENDAWQNLSTSVSTELAEGFGTQWNDWESIWTGKENFISNEEVDPSSLITSSLARIQNRQTQNYIFDVVDRIGSVSSGLPNRMEKDMTNKKIDTSVVPFMRSDEIIFVATNLKPNTVFYPFFDDVSISSSDIQACLKLTLSDPSKVFVDGIYDGEIITSVNGSAKVVKNCNDGSGDVFIKMISGSFTVGDSIIGSNSSIQTNITNIDSPTELKSDSIGQLCGVFNLPSEENKKFRTGQRLFRLIDNNSNQLNDSESLAEVIYSSQGLMDDPENSIVSTRTPLTKRSNICDILSISKDVFSRELNSINRCLDWKDPLSQTFIIDSASSRNGIFLKSVDLYFKSKDETLPVMIEIRPTINGYPSTSTVVPFSEVILNPSQVSVSSGPDPLSQTNTRFNFDSPVYLTPGEYAIVIKTNSSRYEIWSGVVGETMLNSDGSYNILNEKVTKQPLVGNLYSSHNSGTWEQINNESVMFRLNKCKFDYSTDSLISMNVQQPSQSEDFSLFKFNTSLLKNFSNNVNPSFYYKIGSGSWTEFHENRNIELDEVKQISSTSEVKLKATIPNQTNPDENISPVMDLERLSFITVDNIIDSVEYDTSDITIQDGGTGFVQGDILKLNDEIDGVVNSNKFSSFTISVDSNGSITGLSPLVISKNMVNDVNIQITNSAGQASTGSGEVIVVDSETSPSGSIADSVYISKRVNLKSPYESKDLRVYLDLYKPTNTEVHVYYKVASTNDSTIFEDRKWYLMSQVTPQYVISEYNNDYREFVFSTNGGVKLIEDGILDNFNIYSIKIVLSSSDKSKTPKVRNLRAIALQDTAGI